MRADRDAPVRSTTITDHERLHVDSRDEQLRTGDHGACCDACRYARFALPDSRGGYNTEMRVCVHGWPLLPKRATHFSKVCDSWESACGR